MKRIAGLLPSFLLLGISFCGHARAGDFLTVATVGDVMMGTTWPEEILPPGDGAGIFDNVRGAFEGADIVFGNLEGVLSDNVTEGKCGKRKKGVRALCFEFRMPTRYARHLEAAGFHAMSIANNHAFDFGLSGIESTVETLCAEGIQPVGGSRIASFTVRCKTVAIAGFSYSPLSPYSHSVLDIPEAMDTVSELSDEYDLVIVSFHGGAEGREALRIPQEEEVFAGERRGDVVRFARAVIDAGADLVIGHGPHVPRALEIYEGKLIAYSLGNFLTYGRFNIQGPSGVSFVLRASVDMETGDFAGGRIVPVELRDGGVPYFDPEGKAVRLIRELTEERGTPPGLVIEDDGEIRPAPESEDS